MQLGGSVGVARFRSPTCWEVYVPQGAAVRFGQHVGAPALSTSVCRCQYVFRLRLGAVAQLSAKRSWRAMHAVIGWFAVFLCAIVEALAMSVLYIQMCAAPTTALYWTSTVMQFCFVLRIFAYFSYSLICIIL